jgi:hypothetical protein
MRGDQVVVRTAGGEPRLVRVWDVAGEVVLICSEENYQTLVSGKEGLWPVGFPKKDVFGYNPSQEKMLRNWKTDRAMWEHLASYV